MSNTVQLTKNGQPVFPVTDESLVMGLNSRPYNSSNPDGMGYLVLKKNKTFAEQVTEANTIYEIRYDFDLGGASVTIPAGCVLKFNGGMIKNGSISGSNTILQECFSQIFDNNVLLSGTWATVLNPLMFGLSGTNGSTSYSILYATHSNANRIKSDVSYKGIDSINIQIPEQSMPIPISGCVDYSGCVFYVKNDTSNAAFLFSMDNENEQNAVTVEKSLFDGTDFSSVNEIPNDPVILVTEDETVWCPRIGHQQNYIRKDIAFLINKKASNTSIFTYNTEDSVPSCYYKQVSTERKSVKNASFIRENSQSDIYLFKFYEQYNIEVKNIMFSTPKDTTLLYDRAIYIENCVDVTLDNITIDGTYSSASTYGYAIEVDNVAMLSVRNVNGQAKWHEFASKSLNGVIMEDCSIKTFDCHSYGKNISIKRCHFQTAVQVGYGVFGTLQIYDTSISSPADTMIVTGTLGFNCDIEIHDCKIKATSYYSLFDFSPAPVDERDRRSDVEWEEFPDIMIDGLTITNLANIHVLIARSSSSNSYTFSNSPIISIGRITSSNTLRLSFKRYDTLIFSQLPKLNIKDSDLKDNVIQYLSLGTTANTDEALSLLTYENCVVDFSLTDRLARLQRSKYPVSFINCIIKNSAHAPANGYTAKSFVDCVIYCSNLSSALYSQIFPGIYIRCNIKLNNSSKLLALGSTGLSWMKFVDCVGVGVDNKLFVDFGEYIPNKYSFVPAGAYNKIFLSEPICGTTLPSLSSNLRAWGVEMTSGKMEFWNGTAWVNMDGTALS